MSLSLLLAGFLLWPMDTARTLGAAPSGELLDRAGQPLYFYLNAQQQWCFERELAAVSPRLVQATLAVEDQRFYRHHGVDPLAVLRAGWQFVRHGRIRSGASTLTMQVVKLAGQPSHSLLGKARQMASALRLEMRTDKPAILQAYLNRAPYGLNLLGCEAAARRYFGKPARELTLAEAALLAALPKAPTGLMPLKHPERALRRRNYVLARMQEEGFLSAAERERAAASPLGAGWHAFPDLAPHLAMRLRPLARRRSHLGTTLDRDTQALAEGLLRQDLKKYAGEVGNGAVIVLDAPSAAVLARVGSANFFSKQKGSQFDAARARRSPGSALKPFTYALAFDGNRLYPSEVLLDGTLDLGSYNPKNFDQRYHGLIPAGDALRQSLNVPAVLVLGRVGYDRLHQFLGRAGLSTLRRPARGYGLGLTLGNCEVRLDELAASYCLLANLGEYRPLTTLTAAAPQPRRLLSRGACLSIYDALEQPLPDELDGAALGAINAPPRVAWKTGTSTGNHDAWAFVFNRHYVVGVWLGNNNGRPSRRLVGARAALPLAAQIFRGLKPRPTPAWPEAGEDLQSAEVCSISGLPRSNWCRHTRLARLPRGAWLNRVCDMHWPGGEERGTAAAQVLERWPGSAKRWDLARIDAPVVVGRQPQGSGSASTALQILNPPNAAKFVLTGEADGDRIRLRSSIDAQGPLHWYCNDRFVATAEPGQPVLLGLTPGRHKLVCMTPEGLTAQVRFQVTAPGGTLNFREE